MNSFRMYAIAITFTATGVVGCSGDGGGAAPAASKAVEVVGGTAAVELVHLDQALAFDHVKAVRRYDEEAGADRILMVFTQQEVDNDPLTRPFAAFDVNRWSLANHPQEIRAVLSVLIDPQEPEKVLACDVFGEPSWLQGGCGEHHPSLDVAVTGDAVEGILRIPMG